MRGLPRVVELFEARRPKEPAVITEVNGVVKFGDVTKSHRKVMVVTPDGEEHEYQLSRGAHVNVREGESVVAGDPLMDGPIDPHDILKAYQRVEIPEEVYETREESFDQDYTKPDMGSEEVVTGGSYGADS